MTTTVRCDVCGEEVINEDRGSIWLRPPFERFGKQITIGWDLCQTCAESISEEIQKFRDKIKNDTVEKLKEADDDKDKWHCDGCNFWCLVDSEIHPEKCILSGIDCKHVWRRGWDRPS